MAADLAVLSVHRYTGEVAHVLVGAGELVEQGGFAAVLVACKGKHQRGPVRNGGPAVLFFPVAGIHLTRTRMHLGCMAVGMARPDQRSGGTFIRNFNVLGICQAQGQLIPTQFQFHRVSHRGRFAQGHCGARGKPHIQQVAAQRPRAPYGTDGGTAPHRKLTQLHFCFTFLVQ